MFNEANWEKFKVAYRQGLEAAVQAKPDDYYTQGATPEKYAEVVSARILVAIKRKPTDVNYGGGGFRRACKSLGIKHTRKAIFEYLGIGPKADG